ncbi:Hypothetical protein R9X50_00050000 [Acrodontium crateriforme]|uniref:tRNA(Phe) 7-[(3-amino-3-carboxypropyl)-4-demethylwyosine(37)-N(4)]-methyltransferase n=1 Tax=Acrodontium crateriforme TaxID=150365 RepID=A0AAQ3R766_9PEZI|nr:Hypothetical protein R9X50_00050000 [Acrodontium crateriforme]
MVTPTFSCLHPIKMSTSFAAKKAKILEQLNVPDDEYSDASPKGSVDLNIAELIAEINGLEGFVTTSSCGGRISVYLEGPPKPPKGAQESPAATAATSTGGKGGGEWLFGSHEPFEIPDALQGSGLLYERLGLPRNTAVQCPPDTAGIRFVHLKFEPMILHILTSSTENAQCALTAAMEAGFRESGISGLGNQTSRSKAPVTPMVAVRTSGMALSSIIGYMAPTGEIHPMVSEPFLLTVLKIANGRFETNEQRKERFRSMLHTRISKKDEEINTRRQRREGRQPRDVNAGSTTDAPISDGVTEPTSAGDSRSGESSANYSGRPPSRTMDFDLILSPPDFMNPDES